MMDQPFTFNYKSSPRQFELDTWSTASQGSCGFGWHPDWPRKIEEMDRERPLSSYFKFLVGGPLHFDPPTAEKLRIPSICYTPEERYLEVKIPGSLLRWQLDQWIEASLTEGRGVLSVSHAVYAARLLGAILSEEQRLGIPMLTQDELEGIKKTLLQQLHLEESQHNAALESHPDILFEAELFKTALNGERLAIVSDLNGTLGDFNFDHFEPFPGVELAIKDACPLTNVVILTGGRAETVSSRFLEPLKLIKEESGDAGDTIYRGDFNDANNLSVISRSGMETLEYNDRDGAFERRKLLDGLTLKEEISINTLILEAKGHFQQKAAQFTFSHSDGNGPWTVIPSGEEGSHTISLCPFGILSTDGKREFLQNKGAMQLFFEVIEFLNSRFNKVGLRSTISASRGGDSTIDIRPIHKGWAVQLLRERLGPGVKIVYLGDKFASYHFCEEGHETVVRGNDWWVLPNVDMAVSISRSRDDRGVINYGSHIFPLSLDRNTLGVNMAICNVNFANRIYWLLSRRNKDSAPATA